MHKDTKNQSYVGLSGQTLATNVSMILCDSQIHHETHVQAPKVPNKILACCGMLQAVGQGYHHFPKAAQVSKTCDASVV